MFDALITWSIRQRTVVLLAAAALMVFGIWSSTHARTDVLPDFTPPRVVVQTEAPGMATPDVEELVTKPLERVLLGTPQSTIVRSTSSPGLSVVTLLFEDSIDVYRARQLVGERVDLARGRLPSAVRSPQLAPISAPIGAILKFSITSSSPDPHAFRDVRSFAEWQLRPKLLAVPGVSQVTVLGGDVERIEVRPDPERMKAAGVTIAQLTAAIEGSQSLAGAGFVTLGEQRLDLQNDARIAVADAVRVIADVPLPRVQGTPLRIGDVAEVVRDDAPRIGAALYDGRPSVFVQVNKLPSADTLRVTAEVEQVLRGIAPDLPPGARIEAPVFRQASFIRTALTSVGRAMAIGGALVVLVLVLFLRSPRLAAISLAAIPLSILGAVSVLVTFGVTIDGMTLGGLAIAVGEVVDDAIVDVENVWRRLQENRALAEPRPAYDVIHDASREVRSSVVYATVIVCVVLLPVLMLGGIAGRIFSPLARAYVLAIITSLLVALTVTPAMCAWLLPRVSPGQARRTRAAEFLLGRYRRVLRTAIARPRRVLVGAAVLVLGSIAVVPMLGGRFLPEFHEGALIAHVHAAPGTSLEQTMVLAAEVDRRLRPDLASHVGARAGRAELDEDAAPVNRLEMDIVLANFGDREWDQVGIDVAKRVGAVPGLGFVVEGFLGERIHEILSGETSPIVVKISGPDLDRLRALAREVATTMEKTPGLGLVAVEPQIDVPQIRIRPDRVALARYGVRAADLVEALIAWRQGRSWTQLIASNGRIVDVVVAGPAPMRALDALRDVPVSISNGQVVPLAELATVERVATPSIINRESGERRISIGASGSGSSLSGAVANLERTVRASVALPPGYRIDIGGEAKGRSDAATRLLLIGALVLLGIFVFLSTAFRSTTDALIVLLNIPLGLAGGVVAAAFTPEGLSVAGFVGFVTLFGIISRNGIMLVAHKRQLDRDYPAEDPVERIVRAAEERVLPIVMTAATAGLGLLPLALSFQAAGSELEAPMALIVCGGLITSTALNLVVLPVVYVWLARRTAKRAEALG